MLAISMYYLCMQKRFLVSLPPTSIAVLSSHSKIISVTTRISSTVWENLLYWKETFLKVFCIYEVIYLLRLQLVSHNVKRKMTWQKPITTTETFQHWVFILVVWLVFGGFFQCITLNGHAANVSILFNLVRYLLCSTILNLKKEKGMAIAYGHCIERCMDFAIALQIYHITDTLFLQKISRIQIA